jgi:hypothetical protein
MRSVQVGYHTRSFVEDGVELEILTVPYLIEQEKRGNWRPIRLSSR